MDRPPSQLENARPSGLKPPSRLPAMSNTTGRTLLETSQSDLNAKTSTAMGPMAPPSVAGGSMKHKIAGLPEPPSKRKTLAERAGEPLHPMRSHMPHPAKPSFTRSEGIFTTTGPRPQPNMGGYISTTGYRNTSNTSTSSSLSNARPASRQNGARAVPGRPPSGADMRSAVEEAETEAGVMGKRKGTPILSFKPVSAITLRKTRTTQDLRNQNKLQSVDVSARSQHSGTCIRSLSSSTCNRTTASRSSSHTDTEHQHRPASTTSLSSAQQEGTTQPVRNTSLVSAFAGLSLTPKPTNRKFSGPASSTAKHRPSLSPVKELISPSKIPKFSCTPSLRHAPSAQTLLTNPSPLKSKRSANGLRTPAPSASKGVNSISSVRDGAGMGGDVGIPVFLTKEKLTPSSLPAWDTKGRLEDMEHLYAMLRTQFASAADSKSALEESMELLKSRVHELTRENKELATEKKNLTSDLDRARNDLHATTTDLRQARRDHERDVQDMERKHERDINDLYAKQEREGQRLERELEQIAQSGQKELEDMKRAMEKQRDDETAELTTQHWEEVEEMKASHQREVDKLKGDLDDLRRSGESRATESAGEVQQLRDSMAGLQTELDTADVTMKALRLQIAASEARTASLEQEKASLVSKTHFLEGNQEAQSQEFTTMRDQLSAAQASEAAVLDQLRKEEMARRKLNAQILELKGNIRVFVRTRPLLSGEEDDPAKVEYPDIDDLDGGKAMVVHGPKQLTATGKERIEKHNYAFDRVFAPTTANTQVFEDCRELIQSVVDGYNVSILSYGQTGSGKTFGMSGSDGIIPSSIKLLLEEMRRLKGKGWEYVVEAGFVEVYNETLNDLLGDAKSWDVDAGADDMSASTSVRGKKKEKHEIHHDPTTGKTTVTNLTSVPLWPPPSFDADSANDTTSYTEVAVTRLLETAARNRRVAATNSNARSSRSHSIFMLTLRGSCTASGEASEGVLNLVDLAGSERLKQSGAEGNRMKETQAINKSLSSLGDVIAALGGKGGSVGGEGHVPYRNSKLTYLLQSSLGGTAANGKSSRTLMLLHLSPLLAHWQESRSSLLFGCKVHGTHIGAAKKR